MSENNQPDVRLDENPNGSVSFATDVVATIAGLAVTEVEGVASMASQGGGLVDMFARKNSLTKGVRIDLDGNKVTVDITIVVEYGSPVPDVARNIQENVKKAIENMSGLDVRSVDVHVCGVSFEREQRTNAELEEQRRSMLGQSEDEAPEESTSLESHSDAEGYGEDGWQDDAGLTGDDEAGKVTGGEAETCAETEPESEEEDA